MSAEPRPIALLPAELSRLAAEPHRFDFMAALRLIEAAYPERARLGEARRARDEPVRLGQPPHMAFPPAQIAAFRGGQDGAPARLQAYVFGMFGPQGPLPLHVTRYAMTRARVSRDPTFAHFVDVLHHRLTALYYRAWAAGRPALEQDRPERDRFARRLGGIAGMPTPAYLQRSELPDRFVLMGVGLFAMQSRPPEALARLVALLLRVPVSIREFVGGWLDIPRDAQTRLGRADGASTLGVDAVVGERSFARHHRFRIVLGPLPFTEFYRLLPIGGRLPRLRALVRHAAGLELDWDLQLILQRREVPTARLDGGTHLGWTSWLATHTRGRDADDLVLSGEARTPYERENTGARHHA